MTQKKSYVLPIVMMIALFGMISFVTGLQNPMAIIVKNQFAASNFMSQLGNFANFIAYAFMGIPAGLLLQKIGYKKTALAAIAVGFVGVGIQYLSGQVGSFSVYLIGAFVCGFSMCMLNTVVNPMLNTLGGGGNKGNQLIQVGGSFNSLNATIVPVLVGYLIGNASQATIKDANPALFIAMGIFALAFIVLRLVAIPEPRLAIQKASTEKAKHSPLSFRHFVLGAIGIFVYVGVEVGIPNIANLFMTSGIEDGGLGIDTTIAGTVVGTYWFLMLVGRLVGASVGAKISSKGMLLFASGIGIILVLLAMILPIDTLVSMPVFRSDISFGFAQVPISIMLLVLCGLCTSIMWGGIFNLAVEGLGKYTEAASGIFMVMVCGGGILPLLQGYIADLSTYMASFWVILISLAFLFYYALIGSKNVNIDIPVEDEPILITEQTQTA
ncbi:MAG: MFS transporter [Prolixibacteraceae bacterium]|jgi:FHS family L-fucose permease-like MFS transporter|nr:MFS transporter [Prolixibacteraceae bacterium]